MDVPLIESGMVQGVHVVQKVERRAFFPNEIQMLVAAVAQLAAVVSGACLLERVATADGQAPGWAVFSDRHRFAPGQECGRL
jgi:signal transduction protein with GAF and PtsI domain